jgi:hypothetical protein
VSNKLKSLAKATRISLRRRGTDWLLSSALEEQLFRISDVLSEGSTRTGATGQATYFGSTMITVDLRRLSVRAEGLSETAAREALLRAIDGSVRVHLRAMRMARAEAARRVHRHTLGTAISEMRAGLQGDRLHIDVDLEVPLRVSSRATRPG